MRCVYYPGTFDPPTLGHQDIVKRALAICDRLVIGVGVHPAKKPMLTGAERVHLLQLELQQLGAAAKSEVLLSDGLTVDAARKAGAQAIIRGLRDASDLSYETQMAGMNKALAPEIETVFLSASPDVSHITATLVRQIASMGGDFSLFVSPAIADFIERKAVSP